MTDQAQRLRALSQEFTRRQGKRDAILARHKQDAGRVEYHTANVKRHEAAVEVLQAAVATRREELRVRVEALVTRGLRAVFGRPDYEFYLDVRAMRDVMATIPMLRCLYKGRVLDTEIVEGHGGGVADVVGFVLRVIVLCMTRPKSAPVLVLDEPFRHVSNEHLRGCAQLLRELNRSAGIQFVIVTHKPELLDAADVTYRTQVDDGVTTFVLEDDVRDDAYHAKPAEGATKRDQPSMWDGQELVGNTTEFDSVLPDTDDPLSKLQRAGRTGRGKGWAVANLARDPEGQDPLAAREAKRKLKREALDVPPEEVE